MALHNVNADLKEPLKVAENDIIRVDLGENPSTGYVWEITKINLSEIQLIGESYKAYKTKFVGSGGEKKIDFKVLKKAKGTIKFEYVQKWSNDVDKTFCINYV